MSQTGVAPHALQGEEGGGSTGLIRGTGSNTTPPGLGRPGPTRKMKIPGIEVVLPTPLRT